MSPLRLGITISIVLLGLSGGMYLVLMEKAQPNHPSTSLPEPISYAKFTRNKQFVLAVHGSLEAEAKLKDGEMKRYAAEVRAKYPKPGMYSADGKLVYPLEGNYVPDENVYLTDDGRHVVRLEGDWWKTKAYPAGTRLSPEKEKEQLDAPAVTLFADGKSLKSHSVREITTDYDRLPHSPQHILWPGEAVLMESDSRFLIDTQDSNRSIFDVSTGERVVFKKIGFGDRFAQITILGTLGLTLILAVVAGWWIFRKSSSRQVLNSSEPDRIS